MLNSSVIICDSEKKNEDSVDTCNKCLELEAELVKKNDVYIELSKWFLNLEQHCISLEVSIQLDKEIFQKDQSSDLKAQIQEKVFANATLKNELRKLKGKNVIDTIVSNHHATTIAPEMYTLELDTLPPKVLKNMDAYIAYIKHSRDHADTLRDIVESARELGRTFTTVRNKCLLTRFTSTKVVPLKKSTIHSVVTPTQGIKVVQIVLWYLESGCSKHMTENRSQLTNFINKFLGTVKFEAVATTCYTQNRSLIRLHHGKTPYELLHDRKLDLSYLYVFGALCYPTNDSEDLGKLKSKADVGIFIGYAPVKKTTLQASHLKEKKSVRFNGHMAFEKFGSGPEPQLLTTGTLNLGLVPNPPSSTPYVRPTKNDWDILFQPMFDVFLNPPPSVVYLVPTTTTQRLANPID
uniref:Retrovirus-related Pol polyprotein from transposon TNT 1-94 n=1 Tax=Tanacetum cinerariifolium TaxID=118510 RepID=A0A6L2JBJ3_TANCI|nr:retrovirus-related Pol polyprotein from transposon TNT 1-94 [Tanacetum cinerariifolium]